MNHEEDGQTCYCYDCSDAWRIAHKKAVHELQELKTELMMWQASAELFRAWINQRGFDRHIQNSASLRLAVRAYEEAQNKSQ